MSERNDKMAAMLAAEAPAARDLSFEIAVLARIEQRRFVRSLTRNLVIAAVLALALALLAPQLELIPALAAKWSGALGGLAGNSALMAMLVLTGLVAWYFRPAEA